VKPDASRLGAHLTPGELDSLRELARLHGWPFSSWPELPEARGFLDLALSRGTRSALRSGRARSMTHALRLVAPGLGLDGDSVARRWRRRRGEESGQSVRHRPPDLR